MHAICCLFFHENRTMLKMESEEVGDTIKTINFTHSIIKFVIPIHLIKGNIKCKSEGKKGLNYKILKQKSGL